MSDERFDSLVREYFYRLMELNPVAATFFGIHEHDGRLPEGTRREVQQTISLVREFRSEVEEIDPSSLSRDRRLDWELAIHMCDLSLFSMEVLRAWEKVSPAADTIGDGLFLLLARDYPELERRVESMASRLEQFPRYESNCRELVSSPVRLWNQVALESLRGLPALFEAVRRAAEGTPHGARVEEAASTAAEAVQRHASWLESEVIPRASERFWIGPELFEELLRLRGLGMTSDEILRLGYEYLERLKELRAELARRIDPEASPEEVLKRIKEKHPETFEEALEAYRRAMGEARRFVIERGVATVPEDERLVVVETPPYMRHVLPFAAYVPPARFDPIKQGIYLVTPPPSPEVLAEHSYPSIENTTVHEGYPGHHLQFACAAKNPSLVRALAEGTEFVEGWAFYCEEMMKDMGFHDDPEHRLIMVNDLIWRAVRIVLDVKLQRGEISFEEAVDFLVEQTGMAREAAVSEVRWYTMRPSYPLSYLLGKHLIMELRRELEERLGERFDLRRFHDAMLYAGPLPWKFMRRVVLEEFGLA